MFHVDMPQKTPTKNHTHTHTEWACITETNLSSREFLVGCLILGHWWKETVCSIVGPYVRVYSLLALNGAITLCFHAGKQ